MAIFSIWNKCVQQRSSTSAPNNNQQRDSDSLGRNRRNSIKFGKQSELQQLKLHDHKSRTSISVYDHVSRVGNHKSDYYPKNNGGHKRDRHYKYLYPIALCLTNLAIAPATLAADVGGVSATANPIDNSSGSVTNQAIQVLQGPYITNTYGGGISCQGTNCKLHSIHYSCRNDKDPFETFYMEPQYDNRDFEGRMVEVQKNVKNWTLGKIGMIIELIQMLMVKQ